MSKKDKFSQHYINRMVEHICNLAEHEIQTSILHKRLRTCQAWIYESDNYYFLKSYNTIVAIIYKRTNTLYDCLRLVYGYTATSAQHISKFANDMGVSTVYTYYTV